MEEDDQKLTEWALRVIGAVDYDIEKEVTYNIEEFGKDDLVEEVKQVLLGIIEEL